MQSRRVGLARRDARPGRKPYTDLGPWEWGITAVTKCGESVFFMLSAMTMREANAMARRIPALKFVTSIKRHHQTHKGP